MAALLDYYNIIIIGSNDNMQMQVIIYYDSMM